MLCPRVFLAPHVPTLVLDEHRRHATPMLSALAAAREALAGDGPTVLVALSARWMSNGPFLADESPRLSTLTDYSGFGVEVRYNVAGAPALAHAVVAAGEKAGVRVGPARRGLDSGASVPLHFLAPERRLPVLALSLAPLDAAACRAWGRTLRGTLAAREERVAFVIGGLLSANLHAWNLRREVPEAAALDAWALDLMERGAWDALAAPPAAWLEAARPEAGLRHLEVLHGFLGPDAQGVVHAHEPAPGLGAALVEFALEG
jgi:aromatic ring-opening dioxygenase catalytic subunit (LigB family)